MADLLSKLANTKPSGCNRSFIQEHLPTPNVMLDSILQIIGEDHWMQDPSTSYCTENNRKMLSRQKLYGNMHHDTW